MLQDERKQHIALRLAEQLLTAVTPPLTLQSCVHNEDSPPARPTAVRGDSFRTYDGDRLGVRAPREHRLPRRLRSTVGKELRNYVAGRVDHCHAAGTAGSELGGALNKLAAPLVVHREITLLCK